MRRRHLHACAGKPECRGAEVGPGKPAVLAPERVEPGGDARHGAGGRSDRVVDELLAEGNLELEQLAAATARHGAEAVEEARPPGRRVPVDRVPAAEQPSHDRLRDAGGEAGGNRGVRCRAADLQNLDSCLSRRGMARSNGRSQHPC